METTKRALGALGESSARAADASASCTLGASATCTQAGVGEEEEAHAPRTGTTAHALLLAERAAVGRLISFDGRQYSAPLSPNALKDQLLSNLRSFSRESSNASSTESMKGVRGAGLDARVTATSAAAAGDSLARRGSGGGAKGRLAELARDHGPSFDGNAPSTFAPPWLAGGLRSPIQRTAPQRLPSPLSPKGDRSLSPYGSRRGLRRGSQRAAQRKSSQSTPQRDTSLSSPGSPGTSSCSPGSVAPSPLISPAQTEWSRGRARSRTLSIDIDLVDSTPVILPGQGTSPMSPRVASLLRDATCTAKLDQGAGEAMFAHGGRMSPRAIPVGGGANGRRAVARPSPLSPHGSFRTPTLEDALQPNAVKRTIAKKLSIEIEFPTSMPAMQPPRSPRVASLLRDAASQLDHEGEARVMLQGRSSTPPTPASPLSPRGRARCASAPTSGRRASSSDGRSRSLSVDVHHNTPLTPPLSPRIAALVRGARPAVEDTAPFAGAPQSARRARAGSAGNSSGRPCRGPSPLSPRGNSFADDRIP